jgi:hypothetical protein
MKTYFSLNIISMQEMRNVNKMSVGKPEGKRPLGRPKHRSEVYSKMGRKEWIKFSTDRV